MDGVLVIDKPDGPTSHDIVAVARRALHLSRIGHTGTLDPFATGVLPLVVGRATRLAQFLATGSKAYRATVQLGRATTTYDRTGHELPATDWLASPGVELTAAARSAAETTDAEIEAVVSRFSGTFAQRPPIFSAKKVEGHKAYELARANRPVALAPVPVSLHAWRLAARDGDLVVLEIECSAGFYVRSLAHDIGVALGCGAHLAELRRTRSSGFGLDDALTLDDWSKAGQKLVGLDRLLPWLASATLSPRGQTRVRQGQPARPDDVLERHQAATVEGPVRLFSSEGALLGLAKPSEDGFLHPFLNLV